MKKYIFKNKKFDLIICLNGELPPKEVFELLDGIPLIAADGAYNKLNSFGFHPTAIVGDMDSVEVEHNPTLTHFEKIESQDTNDFEKCIKFISNQNYKSILIIGFTGGLLEHTMNNTSILIKYKKKYEFIVYHQNRYCFLLSESKILNISKGEIVSIIPFPKVKLTTKGLKWELDNEYLELGTREGARNIATQKKIALELHEGLCLVFIDSRLPLRPVEIK